MNTGTVRVLPGISGKILLFSPVTVLWFLFYALVHFKFRLSCSGFLFPFGYGSYMLIIEVMLLKCNVDYITVSYY